MSLGLGLFRGDTVGRVVPPLAAGMARDDEVVQLFLQDAGRVHVHQDANFNVTTLTDLTGRVLERYFYSPYGQLEAVIDAHPFDYDGDVEMAVADCEACEGDYSGDYRRFDADGDRDIDADDCEIVGAFVGGLSGDTRWTRVPSSPRSRLGNPFAHQGLLLDAEIASYQNRARHYNPGLKRFMQRDPLGLMSRISMGLNDYEYVHSAPVHLRDFLGLLSIPREECCPWVFIICTLESWWNGLDNDCLYWFNECMTLPDDQDPCHAGPQPGGWVRDWCFLHPKSRGCHVPDWGWRYCDLDPSAHWCGGKGCMDACVTRCGKDRNCACGWPIHGRLQCWDECGFDCYPKCHPWDPEPSIDVLPL